jgi:hypothetical protein
MDTTVEITVKTAEVLLKIVNTALGKKNWIRENKPDVVDEKFQARYDEELTAYAELQKVLGIETT